MSESPAKRRKTSPTTSIPINAPILQNRNATTPSFASPTRASIAKRDAALLSRGISPTKHVAEPASSGKNLNDLFAKALGEVRPTIEGEAPGTKTGRTLGGNFSVKPRRISRSPSKPAKSVERAIAPPVDLEGVTNPFQKKGLRRSPTVSQPESVIPNSQQTEEDDFNPFQKRGLRRSPTGSQSAQLLQPPQLSQPLQQTAEERAVLDPFTTTPPGAPPSRALGSSRVSEVLATPSLASASRATQLVSPNVETRSRSNLVPTETEVPPSLEQAIPTAPSPKVQQRAQNGNIQSREVEGPLIRDDRAIVSSEPILSVTKGQTNLEQKPEPAKASSISNLNHSNISPSTRRLRSERAISRREGSQEPDLPPTPTQRGLADPVVTTPPTGIHNTPSKRERTRQKKALKSSPLKPRDARPEETVASLPLANEPKSTSPSKAPKGVSQLEKTQKRRQSVRFLIPEDPHRDKKKERDALLYEIQQLQADVKLGNEEVERLRLLHQAPSKQIAMAHNIEASKELVPMLLRSTNKPTTSLPPAKPKTIFSSINAFLPFRSKRKPTAISTVAKQALEKPLPSLLPMEQSNPLVFLQAFSPLHYTQTINLLPLTPSSPETHSSDVTTQLREHHITASHPSQLFLSQLSLVVNTSNHTIHALEVSQIDPSAKSELGLFLKEKAEAKELSVIGWAMGRWAEVASIRAKFWCATEAEFADSEARKASIQSIQANSKKRKRAGTAPLDGESETQTRQEKKWSRRELLVHMGRTSFDIIGEEVLLRIEWNIKFDWTGEAESVISAVAKLPDSCKCSSNCDQSEHQLTRIMTGHAQDERRSLDAIPSTFQQLVKKQGPLDAVRGIVYLLFSEE